MENNQILKYLNQYGSEILLKLTAKKWQHFKYYFKIREKYLSNDLDDSFEKDFCWFYAMNGARGLNKPQKKEFFKLLSLKETDLEKILEVLYETPGYKDSRRLFLSFGAKLLHAINENLPIYDGNIAHILDELPTQIYPASLKERIKNRIDIYKHLKERLNSMLSDIGYKNYLKNIREELQSMATDVGFRWHNELISDTKLLDSLLWSLYFILKEHHFLKNL